MAPGKIEDGPFTFNEPEQQSPNFIAKSAVSLEKWHLETERIILQQKAIKAAKVIRLDNAGTSTTLTEWAAFISLSQAASDDGATAIREARKALKKARRIASTANLPNPKQWHIVAEMPLATNGTVDEALLRRILVGDSSGSAMFILKSNIRRILKAYTFLDANSDNRHTKATPMEESMKLLWSHVLKIGADKIHNNDTFIRRGGDSITAIELTTTAHECGISVDVATIIQHPRLDAMAAAATLIEQEELATPNPFSLLSPTVVPDLLLAAHQQCGIPDNEIIEDAYPCSPLQEGLMGLAMKQPGSYITRRSYPLPSTVDIGQFRRAWERTVRACANLRTRIIMYQGRAVQVVWNDDISWHELPLSPETRGAEDLKVHYGSRLCYYAIVQDPLENTHQFIWAMHHSIFDGWTVRTILSILYRHYYRPDAPLEVLPTYSKFIKYTQSMNNAYAAEYWKVQLVGAKRATFPPSPELESRSESATRHHRSTMLMPDMADTSITKAVLLRTAWAFLLSEYCDTEDVCFGTTVSGRQAAVPGLDRMVGPVVATVPVRIRLSDTSRISELLSDVQAQAAEMIRHEHFGLQNIAKLSLDAKDACDFTSLLLIQPAIELTPQDGYEEHILAVGGLAEEAMTSFFNYPLMVQAQLHKNGKIELIMTYDSGVLQDGQVDALSHQFNNVIQQLVRADNTDPISTISVAGQWDFQQALRWNDVQRTEQLENIQGFVHELVSDRAMRQPNREAIYSSAQSLTYGQLEAWSSGFANHLRQNGVTRGTVVPICLEKSASAVAAMLGVLKAGGVFLPLDPSHPPARRQALIDQVEAQHLIVSPSEYESSKCMTPVVLQMHEDFEPLTSPEGFCYNASDLTQDSPMYILFTSGSTGRPKAVLVEHGLATKSLWRQVESFDLRQSTRMLQFAAYTFDASLLDIFGTLLAGGTVCIPSSDERLYSTSSFIHESGANTASLSPSFVQTLSPDQFPSLKTLILGGEPSTSDLLERWVGRTRLINTYGLTESCIWNTIHEFTSANESPRTIGRAFNSNCWIVDQHDDQRLAPIGCIGELVLHGPCLAQGYVGDRESTDKVFKCSFGWFLGDVVTTQKDWRFLKTGDLARYNPNGEIELIGRRDTQVKLRGRRIELHEIEATIKSVQCDIEYAAVDLVRLRERDHLVAFVSFDSATDVIKMTKKTGSEDSLQTLELNDDTRSKITLLTEHLGDLLPAYMIPSFILPVKSMPLTTSLKLERKRLKTWAQGMPLDELGKFVAEEGRKLPPITDMEMQLREIWAQILHIKPDNIGRMDSFMKIGGDSISAISLTSLARENGIKLSAAGIFKEPRLCDMALAAVRESRSSSAPKKFSMIGRNKLSELLDDLHRRSGLEQHQEIDDVFPCTPIQEGLMALAVKDPGSYLTRRVIRLPDHVKVDKFRTAWESTIRQCDSLRTRIAKRGEETFQMIIKDDISWQRTAESTDPDKALSNVQIGYGTRLCFYELIENATMGTNYFALCLHHAIYDGWTVRIILDVLQRAYRDASPLEIQPYSTFIQFTEAMDQKAAISYWQDQLLGAKRAAFPPDTHNSRTTQAETRSVIRHSKRSFAIPSTKSSQVTKATVLRAAWAIVLAQYCDTNDVCFGATVSGRQGSIPGVEMMAGPTIAAVPVRIKLDRKQIVSSFLMNVQDQASEMVAYEQFGLRNISRLSEEISDACNFTSRLVIQPSTDFGEHNEYTLLPLGSVVDEGMNMFANDPLVVQIGLSDTDMVDLSISYNITMLSEKETVAVLHQLEHVVTQLTLNQDGPLDAISVAGPWDMGQVRKWNRELELDNDGTCVLDLISARVKIAPNKEAVYSTGRCLSYVEVDSLATKFAYYLGTLGVERGMIIPICFEKSTWAIIAILGIMKAGGVYVPLDAASPIARRKGLVQQVNASLVVASPLQQAACTSLVEKVITISDELLSKIPEQQAIVYHGLSPSDSAYVFFTSGTTGKPKGIVVHHGALSLGIQAHSNRYGIHENTRLYEFSHYNFDVNVMNIFCTLTEGGTICVPSEEERLYTTSTFMSQARVDFASFASSFARTVKPESVPHLKTLLVGGEALAKDVQEMWCSHVKLINGYGPTETTISCVAYDVVSSEQSPNIIGKPFANDCYVVDPENHNKLMAIGCIGELIIHGHNVAKGYLNNPEMTKEAFLDSVDFLPPDESANPRRFYKTGDLVKYLPDGNILYLGRKDTQIKIRGKRIEIGEIEATMKAAIAGVKHVAVELTRLNTREVLVGFVCFDMETVGQLQTTREEVFDEIIPLDSALRNILLNGINVMRETLPSYMVPSIVIPLRSFPFFASMKLDRKTLKKTVSNLSSKRITAYNLASKLKVPPSTALEVKLRDMWARTLKIKPEEIGKHDSFLQIGGDSISAIELATLAQTEGINLTVANIFQSPQLARLASLVTRNSPVLTENIADEIRAFSLIGETEAAELLNDIQEQCGLTSTSEIEDVYPCTPLQEGLLALAEKCPGSYIGTQVYGLPHHIDVGRFKKSWERTADMCSNLRTRIAWVNGRSWQVLLKTQSHWENTDFGEPEDAARYLSRMEMRYGTPLCRYSLVQKDGTHYFAIAIHHAIFDGWTVDIIMDTLHRVYYDKGIAGLQPYSSFVKYTLSQNASLAQEYWREQLDGCTRARFPSTGNSDMLSDPTLLMKRRISIASKETSITKASILRAAWAIVMAQYSMTDDICFGATVSGRLAPVARIARMAGLTIATVPVRVSIDYQQTILSFLQDIQTQSADMVAHEQFGLQNIAKVSPSARAACDFHSLFLVQPAQQSEKVNDGHARILEVSDISEKTVLESAESYFNFPLTAQCFLGKDKVEFHLTYRSGVVSEFEMVALSEHFSHVVDQLLAQDDTLLCNVSVSGQWDLDKQLGWGNTETGWVIVDSRNYHNRVPVGCVGELIYFGSNIPTEYPNARQLNLVGKSDWVNSLMSSDTKVFAMGVLARYLEDGKVTIVGEIEHPNTRTTQKTNESNYRKHQSALVSGQSTEILVKLAGLWARVLGLTFEDIAENDNFLDIGGDSISAIELVALAQKQGINLTVPMVFQNPELGAMAGAAATNSIEVSYETSPLSLVSSSWDDELASNIVSSCSLATADHIEDVYPCTPLQAGLMALTVTQPGSYINKSIYRLAKHIDGEKFIKAWDKTVAACATLRTRIVLSSGEALQVVAKHKPSWESSLLPSGADSIHMGYGLPLCRYGLVEDTQGDRIFILVMHHSIYDGWTVKLILDTFQKAYRGETQIQLQPFANFIKYTLSLNNIEMKSFWATYLKGATPSSFPVLRNIRNEQAKKSSGTIRRQLKLPSNIDSSVTKAVIVRAAWTLLLSRYCETDDVCFGTTVSGRQAPVLGLSYTPGPTIATVPVRVSLQNVKTKSELLRALQEDSTRTVPHEQFGLQNIAKVSTEAREACDFASLLVIQPGTVDSAMMLDDPILLPAESTESDVDQTMQNFFNYPLVLQAIILESEIELLFTFDKNAITEMQLEAVSNHLDHLLQQLSAKDDMPLCNISLVGSWDFEHAIQSSRLCEPTQSCTHWLINEQIQSRPTDLAILAWDQNLTYGELGVLALRLAKKLCDLGVGPDDPIMVCFEKSSWAVVAMLAIQHAGGSIVPLDPAAPKQRLQTIIEDTGSRLALVSPQCCIVLQEMGVMTVTVDEESVSALPVAVPNINTTVQPSNISVTLFTSGSTGKPKGVLLTHENICSSADGYGAEMAIGPGTRVLQFSSYTFDVAILDIFVTLIRGGCICVPSDSERMYDLAGAVKRLNANWAFLTPTVADMLSTEDVPCLRALCLGGEAVSDNTIARWKDGGVQIYNGYGPAESSICSWNPDVYVAETSTNIGRPISSAFWVVEPSNEKKLTPVGCVGELLIQGPLLAKGYLNNGPLSEGKWLDKIDWLPNGFPARGFLTGDLVRRNADGTFDYVGRKDGQIKLHGQRMETAEIEHQILSVCSDAENAVVDAIRSDSGEALVAFVVLRPHCQDGVLDGIVTKLSAVLTPAMIPKYFIVLENMPMTMSGKLDRASLRSKASQMTPTELLQHTRNNRNISRQCSTDLELSIRSHWSQVLGIPEGSIGAEDNFYHLGGDSIRIVTLAQRILKKYGVTLGLSLINSKNTTIASMAELIERVSVGEEPRSFPKIDLHKEFISLINRPWKLQDALHNPITRLPSNAMVFLTGGTGYLGTEILRQLVASDSIETVIVLVRASSAIHGLERVKRTAQIAGWWDAAHATKITIWTGDLAKPQLGLSQEQLQNLEGKASSKPIDAIIHNGAVVNWNADYDKLSAANIDSTLTLLHMATSSPARTKFVYISGGMKETNMMENEQLFDKLAAKNGYAQTKVIAERVVLNVASRLPASQNRVSVVKPGLIIGSVQGGVANIDDFLWRAAATAVLLGKCPLDENGWLHVADVEYVSNVITNQIFSSESISPSIDMLEGMYMSEFWGYIHKELAIQYSPIPFREWVNIALEQVRSVGEKHPLWAAQHFLTQPDEYAARPEGHVTPPVMYDAVRSNVRYLERIGFLSKSVGRLALVQEDAIGRSNMAEYEEQRAGLLNAPFKLESKRRKLNI